MIKDLILIVCAVILAFLLVLLEESIVKSKVKKYENDIDILVEKRLMDAYMKIEKKMQMRDELFERQLIEKLKNELKEE